MFQDNNIHQLDSSHTKLSHIINNSETANDKNALFHILLKENAILHDCILSSDNVNEYIGKLKNWINTYFDNHPKAKAYSENKISGEDALQSISWNDLAAIRIADYLEYNGKSFNDPNNQNETVINQPFQIIFSDYHSYETHSTPHFYLDMIALFRQLNGSLHENKPDRETVEHWMQRHPSGIDRHIAEKRLENKKRIIGKLVEKIDDGTFKSATFQFEDGLSNEQKVERVTEWWETSKFHLVFAFRSPKIINEMLDFSLDEKTLQVMDSARDAGIPFFVNPYYLSLIDIQNDNHTDIPIRDYIFYSQELVDEFGNIHAWEKEDIVKPGKPNAAGWVLPMEHNIHRRYPEVSILIPDTVGRACGGLCVSCQRMYDFQSGHLNFDLDKLKPKEKWTDKLDKLMHYFEEDSQLRDILITGGDALMSGDRSIEKILDAVYDMAIRKREANKNRKEGERYAEMRRVRLGTRLPVYIPQRVTSKLTEVLKNFKDKAQHAGIRQFVIQTHFQSSMEITPEVRKAVKMLHNAGWVVTNQQVFTTAASRRGHSAKLRKALNDIGVLTYYTFSVKGFRENKHNFATNARIVQELYEEKCFGTIPREVRDQISHFPEKAEKIADNINTLRKDLDVPFLATDRSVLNMPGVGKSLTFRTIGITPDGRRILEFDHDKTRRHSPIINKMGKVQVVESKTITELLLQLKNMGENIDDYTTVFGYSMSETEDRMSVYEYPEYDYEVTSEMTNLEV